MLGNHIYFSPGELKERTFITLAKLNILPDENENFHFDRNPFANARGNKQ
jgi:hypothetical protein